MCMCRDTFITLDNSLFRQDAPLSELSTSGSLTYGNCESLWRFQQKAEPVSHGHYKGFYQYIRVVIIPKSVGLVLHFEVLSPVPLLPRYKRWFCLSYQPHFGRDRTYEEMSVASLAWVEFCLVLHQNSSYVESWLSGFYSEWDPDIQRICVWAFRVIECSERHWNTETERLVAWCCMIADVACCRWGKVGYTLTTIFSTWFMSFSASDLPLFFFELLDLPFSVDLMGWSLCVLS